MENFKNKYFLAANSTEGFISYFDKCYNPKENWRNFIIKGGPGTGKSSFMKRVAKKALEKGLNVEVSPCSSDPSSLDAVIIPEKGMVIMDGTAPHTVDPKYPAAVEKILNFGDFWREDDLKTEKEKIIRLTDINKAYHKSASMLLRAAGFVLKDIGDGQLAVTDIDAAKDFAERLSKQYFKKKDKKSKEKIRFLTGISPFGVVSFEDTVNENYKTIICVEDEFGFISNIIMEVIRKNALNKNYEIITVKNAFLPKLTDHILIPSLSLAFVRFGNELSFETNKRKYHTKRFLKAPINITQKKKLFESLKNSAILTLNKAKSVHDDLEEIYIKAMNFESLDSFTEAFIEKEI